MFPREEYERRRQRVRGLMADQGLDGCLIVSPENIYYLCGLNHMGYFAFQMLILAQDGDPILVTREMEGPTIRDTVTDVQHVGYSDGNLPLPELDTEEVPSSATNGEEAEIRGLENMSLGIPARKLDERKSGIDVSSPIRASVDAVRKAGLASANIGMEQTSSFFPYAVAQGIVRNLPHARWQDASGLVNDCRIVQSPLELECTHKAARVADSMMLAAYATAGPSVDKGDIMAAIYHAMFSHGGTYPAFVPLVRSTRTLRHEHGTWDDKRLLKKDILFLEMGGCVRRYHAPLGRLVFVGKPPPKSHEIYQVCREALYAAMQKMKPGNSAAEVYDAWQRVLDKARLSHYRRHHCGYLVGIGFPPSWSGGGVPLGLRDGSSLVLVPGMVFHLVSWLLRTGQGDAFLSDTVVVSEKGCELLTHVSHDVLVR
jgi:Xaa-Pro dipeptidase